MLQLKCEDLIGAIVRRDMEIAQLNRFVGRWKSLFDYNAAIALRIRARPITELQSLIADTKIDARYRKIIEDYELPIMHSFLSRTISADGTVKIDLHQPEESAIKLAFALSQHAHTSRYLYTRWELLRQAFVETVDCPAAVKESAATELEKPMFDGSVFDLKIWSKSHQRRDIDVYFFPRQWKNFHGAGHVRRIRFNALHESMREIALGIIKDSTAPQETKIIKIATKSIDPNEAIDNALNAFFINKDIYNIAIERYGLDPFDDFLDEAMISGETFCFKLSWKYRGVTIERIMQETPGRRAALVNLVATSPSFKSAVCAFSDCFDHALRRDNQYLLKVLSTGLESLLAPLYESNYAQGLLGPSGRVPQLRLGTVLAKIMAFDACRQMFEDITKDLNRYLFKTKKMSTTNPKIADIINLDLKKFVFYGYGIMSDDIYEISHKFHYIEKAKVNIPSFLKGISTRLYFDYLHSTVARNLIIHENVYISNEYLISLLLYTFRVLLSMRVACYSERDGGESNFALLAAAMVYEFNRITGLEGFETSPPILDSAKRADEIFNWGFLAWIGSNFPSRLSESKLRLEDIVRPRLGTNNYYGGLRFNGHFMV